MTDFSCPTCGQALPSSRAVAASIGADGDLLYEGRRVRLRPGERKIFAALLKCPGRPVSWQALASAVWGGADGGPMSAENMIKKYIFALRQTLGRGVIKTHFGEGYSFAPVKDAGP